MRVHTTPEAPEKRRLMHFRSRSNADNGPDDVENDTGRITHVSAQQESAAREERLVVSRSDAEKAVLGLGRGVFVPSKEYLKLTRGFHLPSFHERWEAVDGVANPHA